MRKSIIIFHRSKERNHTVIPIGTEKAWGEKIQKTILIKTFNNASGRQKAHQVFQQRGFNKKKKLVKQVLEDWNSKKRTLK